MIPDMRTLVSLNLAVQLLLAISLAASFGLAKRRMLKKHCAIMRLAMPVQLLAILIVMLPAMEGYREHAPPSRFSRGPGSSRRWGGSSDPLDLCESGLSGAYSALAFPENGYDDGQHPSGSFPCFLGFTSTCAVLLAREEQGQPVLGYRIRGAMTLGFSAILFRPLTPTEIGMA